MTCRRCSECENSSHHWLPNPNLGDAEEGEHSGHAYCCKHCDAQGNECEACYGSGCADEDGPESVECPECNGEGVIQCQS